MATPTAEDRFKYNLLAERINELGAILVAACRADPGCAQQDRCRHIEAKRLGGRHIEHGLVFHRQLHRQIGQLLALKDAVDVGGGAASMAYLVRPI